MSKVCLGSGVVHCKSENIRRNMWDIKVKGVKPGTYTPVPTTLELSVSKMEHILPSV